ncbi:hypothetical protein D3C86_1876380 [compost metagenome]
MTVAPGLREFSAPLTCPPKPPPLFKIVTASERGLINVAENLTTLNLTSKTKSSSWVSIEPAPSIHSKGTLPPDLPLTFALGVGKALTRNCCVPKFSDFPPLLAETLMLKVFPIWSPPTFTE